jgi:glutamine synthetase
VGWRKRRAVLEIFYELDGTPHDLDPRHVLGLVNDRFVGPDPTVAVELDGILPRQSAPETAWSPSLADYSRDRPRNVSYGLRSGRFRPFSR